MKNREMDWRDCSQSEFSRLCLGASGAVSDALKKVKDSLIRQHSQTLGGDKRLLTLAVNEAEALAWETEYPHLFFPILGEETAQASVLWHQRQQTLKREFAFAE